MGEIDDMRKAQVELEGLFQDAAEACDLATAITEALQMESRP